MDERKYNSNQKFKRRAINIYDYVAQIIEEDKSKIGILLCEGTNTSIDVSLYTMVYPEFVVVPADGCSDIKKLMPFMKKYSEYTTFGIIDRDNRSKKQMRMLEKTSGVYCTKLPFIENIICCPEVLKVVSCLLGKNYDDVIKEVRGSLASILADKMSLLNPFNIEIPSDEVVQMVSVTIVTRSSTVCKNIDLTNIMYTFRDKAIVGKVADALGLHGRDEYYNFIKRCIAGEKGGILIHKMAKYLPKISKEGRSFFEDL